MVGVTGSIPVAPTISITIVSSSSLHVIPDASTASVFGFRSSLTSLALRDDNRIPAETIPRTEGAPVSMAIYVSAMRWNELPPGSDFVEVIAQLTKLEARALQKIGNAKFSAPFTSENRSRRERLIHHRAHEIAVVQPLQRRLHHQNGDQFLLRIDPEVSAGDAAPRKIAD